MKLKGHTACLFDIYLYLTPSLGQARQFIPVVHKISFVEKNLFIFGPVC
jgi:hypothetical protein